MEQERLQPVWRKSPSKKRRKKKRQVTHKEHTKYIKHAKHTKRAKRPSRQSGIITAYAVRALVIIILSAMLFLMLCGCLYIRDFFRRSKDTSQNSDSVLESAAYAESSSLRSASPYTIILDAGHGGNDSGTIEQSAVEKDINLSIVLKMMQLRESKNIRVILTRDKDTYMELEDRTQVTRDQEADLFLSIHCNYYEDDSSIRGLECYYSEDSAEGRYYAEKLIENLEEKGTILIRNAKPAEYHVLKKVSIPSVQVETGYLSNSEDRKELASQEYQDKLAAELVEGILKGLEDTKNEAK